MILFFEPICLPKLWGGNQLNQLYHIEEKNMGECCGISAHPKYSTKVMDGPHHGMTLKTLYETYPQYFGHFPDSRFPILVKLIDADKDLSIQVHPHNDYALKHDGDLGKEECWYILKSDNANILIGHDFGHKKQVREAIKQQRLIEHMRFYPIKAYDYFYIPVGTVHAILKHTFLLEVSQSSDVTYRLFDYDRVDKDGHQRDLHIESSLDVMNFPDDKVIKEHQKRYFDFEVIDQNHLESYVAHEYGDYLAILEGFGKMKGKKIQRGDFLMVTSKDSYEINGTLKFARIRII